MKLSPFYRDVATTFLSSVFVAISSIFVTRFLAQGLGPDEFGTFSVGRRVAFLITTFASLDIGVTLARYLGLSRGKGVATIRYFVICFLIVSICTASAVSIGYFLAAPLSSLIFADERAYPAVIGMLVIVAGHSFYTLFHSYLRGVGRIGLSNLLLISIMAIGTMFIAARFSDRSSAADICTYIGILYMTSAPFVILLAIKGFIRGQLAGRFSDSTREICRYCGPRVIGAFAYQGFYSVGPVIAAHIGSVRDAGFLASGQLLVMMIIEIAAGSFSFVALPKAAQMIAENRAQDLQDRTKDLLAIVLQIGIFCSIQLWIWADDIILVWLGEEYELAIPMAKLFSSSFVLYLGFILLRPIIDAIDVKAFNTRNLVVGLLVSAATGGILGKLGLGAIGVAFGVNLGISTLGYLSIRHLWRRYDFHHWDYHLTPTIILNLALIGLGVGVHFVIVSHCGRISSLLLGIGAETLLFAAYLFCLHSSGVTWIRRTVGMVFKA